MDLATWNRREHYSFYKSFSDPIWGATTELDCTKAYHFAKEQRTSFFVLYLFLATHAANQLKAFRLRMEPDDRVRVYDVIHAASTINRADGTFGFSQISYSNNFENFKRSAKEEIERVRKSTTLFSCKNDDNVIHFSTLPWLRFTQNKHAQNLPDLIGIPKMTFGKVTVENNTRRFPVSVHVNLSLIHI